MFSSDCPLWIRAVSPLEHDIPGISISCISDYEAISKYISEHGFGQGVDAAKHDLRHHYC